MPGQFAYRAVARDGSFQVGTITATEVSAVEEVLYAQKLLPVKIEAIRETSPVTLFGFLKGAEYENLIMFTSSLSTMHRAGIPLLRGLSVIRIGGPDSRFNSVIDRLRTEIQSGRMLSEAMDMFPDIFSSVYVSCVAAGEESGHLEETLDELALMLEREMELTRQIKSGIRYPLIVISAIVGAFIVLINFVVPKFASFYSTFNAQLPLPTRIILAVSHFCTTYWPLLLLALVGAGIGVRMLLRNEQGRLWFDTQVLRIPVLGGLIIRGSVARFSLMLQIMVASGLPLVKSVTILAATIKNTAIAAEIRLLADMFRRGREVDVAAGQFHLLPNQALQMLAIGLESGHLEDMLREVGNHYTKQVLYTSRQLTAIIEPVLTLVLGAFVLILALAIFLPMWNLIRVFQG